MRTYGVEELLALKRSKRIELIEKLTTQQKKSIYDNIITLTQSQLLGEISNRKKRIEKRDRYVQDHHEVIHWEYAEYVDTKGKWIDTSIKISTYGDAVTYNPITGHLFILSNDDECHAKIPHYRTIRYDGKNIMLSRAVASTFLPVPEHLEKYAIGLLRSRHLNELKLDNRLDNLLWDGPANNTRGRIF